MVAAVFLLRPLTMHCRTQWGRDMLKPDEKAEKIRKEQESRIHRQIAFASGIFQNDITIRTLLESLPEGSS
jgi:hypothetical protein